MKFIALSAITLCLTTSLSLRAATERDLESHVHGGATLNMAFDDNVLHAEFYSPWMNLVGFEHAPSSAEQHGAIAESVEQLKQGSSLFSFSGTQCEMTDVIVENSMDIDHDESHEDSHGEQGHEVAHEGSHEEHEMEEDHEDTHEEQEKEGDHEDTREEHGHEETASGHSDVLVSYVFNCTDIHRLESVSIGLFSAWSGIEEIEVQLVGPQGQLLRELEPGNEQIDTTPVL